MTQSYAILTTVGRNKEAAALAAGTPLTITEIALGDGTRLPVGAETALENEVHRGVLTGAGVLDPEAHTAYFELYLPIAVGGFVIREAGLFDDAGDLIAIARYDDPIPKFDPASGASNDLNIRMHIIFSDVQNLVFSINPVQAVTINNLVQVLPWASDEQALNAALENLIIDPKRLHLAILELAFPGTDQPPKSPNLTRFHYYADGTQSFPDGTPVNVNCGVEVENNLVNSTYDGVTLTIGDQDAGLWGFLAGSDFVGGAGGFGIDHKIFLSGQGEALAKDNRSAHTASNLATNLVCFERLGAGQQIFHQLSRDDAGGGNGFPQLKTTRFVGMKFSV